MEDSGLWHVFQDTRRLCIYFIICIPLVYRSSGARITPQDTSEIMRSSSLIPMWKPATERRSETI